MSGAISLKGYSALDARLRWLQVLDRRIELWAEGTNRVHDRAVWTRPLQPAGEHAFTGGPWRSTRLNP